MKKKIVILACAFVLGMAFYTIKGEAFMRPWMMGPGYGMGPGMMRSGYGMGPGMMRSGYGMGPGMMGGGGYGNWSCSNFGQPTEQEGVYGKGPGTSGVNDYGAGSCPACEGNEESPAGVRE